jgi:hypothetical protein
MAEETGYPEIELERWVRAVERKQQAVLYGPPGTGKTYLAERLARHLVGGGDGLYQVVQFHPAFAYEDFVQGIRPKTNALGGLEYAVVPGRFVEFCLRARERTGISVLFLSRSYGAQPPRGRPPDDAVLGEHGEAIRAVRSHVVAPASTGNLAQVVAYALAFGAPEAVLIYPSALAADERFVVGNVVVRTLAFSLNGDLGQAGNQFVQALLDV